MPETGILGHRIVVVYEVPSPFQFCHTCSYLVLKTPPIYYLPVQLCKSKVENGSHKAKLVVSAVLCFFWRLEGDIRFFGSSSF